MNVFLVYCVVCWLLAAAILFWFGDESKTEENLTTVGLSAQDHWKVNLLVVLRGPLWVPFVLGAALICLINQQWRLWRSRRCFSEYSLTEINYFDQSPETRAAFDKATAGTMALDFRLVGDYQMKTEPVTTTGRYFWSGDDTTWCSCVWIPDFTDIDDGNIQIDTVLSDGTLIVTAIGDDVYPDTPASVADDHLHESHVPTLSIEEAFGRHVREVHRIATEQDVEILQFDKEQLESRLIYDQRLYHVWLHKIGESGRPPKPELPPEKGRLTPDEYLLTVAGGDFADVDNSRSEEVAMQSSFLGD